MIKRAAYRLVLGLFCGLVVFALIYVEARDNDALPQLEGLNVSIILGSLLYIVLTLSFRIESLVSSLAFAFSAAVLLPPIATILHFVPTYGFPGALVCLPALSGPTLFLTLVALLTTLTIAFIAHYVLRDIAGP